LVHRKPEVKVVAASTTVCGAIEEIGSWSANGGYEAEEKDKNAVPKYARASRQGDLFEKDERIKKKHNFGITPPIRACECVSRF
jgi:hypothetical protein